MDVNKSVTMNRYIEIETYEALQALIAPGAVLEH